MQIGKAAGLDNIRVEEIKAGGPILYKAIADRITLQKKEEHLTHGKHLKL